MPLDDQPSRREVYPSSVHLIHVPRGRLVPPPFGQPSDGYQFIALQPQATTPPSRLAPRPAPPSIGFQFTAFQPQSPQVLSCVADPEWQWRAGYLLGCQLASMNSATLISSPSAAAEIIPPAAAKTVPPAAAEHELAAEALLGMAHLDNDVVTAQHGKKAAPAAQHESARRAPAQRLGFDLTGSEAAEELADYDIGSSTLMEGVAPPRIYESSVVAQQHQGAASAEETTRTAREDEARRLIEIARSSRRGPARRKDCCAANISNPHHSRYSCNANVTPSFHLPLADKIFCREQRPFLPAGLSNAERERLFLAPPNLSPNPHSNPHRHSNPAPNRSRINLAPTLAPSAAPTVTQAVGPDVERTLPG